MDYIQKTHEHYNGKAKETNSKKNIRKAKKTSPKKENHIKINLNNKNNDKLYSLEDYKILHENVLKYKETKDEKYSEFIINSFSAFVNIYIALLKYKECYLSNFSVRSFIKLFSNYKDRRVIDSFKYKKNKTLQSTLSINIAKISSLFDVFTDDDIRHELYYVLLKMANEYKDTKPSFHNYVNKNFHFYAFRNLTKFTKDPSLKAYSCESSYFNNPYKDKIEDLDCKIYDEIADYALRTGCVNDAATSKRYSIYDDRYILDINWINGYSAHSPFNLLTPLERRILVMRYVEGYSDEIIAYKFGISKLTVSKKRAIAKRKMYAYSIKNNLIREKEK